MVYLIIFKEFLRYDSGKDDHERILVFGDPYMTSVLESSKFWLGDGTFKLSPKNFDIKCPLLNRPVTFPPQIWIQRDAAIEGIARKGTKPIFNFSGLLPV